MPLTWSVSCCRQRARVPVPFAVTGLAELVLSLADGEVRAGDGVIGAGE